MICEIVWREIRRRRHRLGTQAFVDRKPFVDQMKRRLSAGCFLTALLLGLPLAGAKAQPAPGGPPAVGVVRAEPQQITQTNEFIGRIQAIGRVALVARVTAFLEKRDFVEGSEVKQGDLLYLLEQPPFQAQVDYNKANVAQLEAQHRNAELTLERAQYLLKTVAGQQSNVDAALAQERSLAAQIAAAQAQLQTAQINLGYTEIRAPIAGRISSTAVTEGNVVSPTSGTLATLVSQDPMYVVFPIALRTGLELRDRYAPKGGFSAVLIRLRLPNGKIYAQVGHLDYVSPTVAENTDTVTVRGVISNSMLRGIKAGDPGSRELTDGEFVTVLLEGVQPVSVLGIPRAAVLSDQQGDYVYVVDAQNKVQIRRIHLGQSTPSTAVVTNGLTEGELVISEGLQRVRPGEVVSPGPATPPPPTPSAFDQGGAGGASGRSPQGGSAAKPAAEKASK
jgi:membrane fusion protein, multidrug efflux system